MPTFLSDARAFILLSTDEVRRRLGLAAVEENSVKYEQLKNLTSLKNATVFPGTVYLKNDRVELIYFTRNTLKDLKPADLERELHGEPILLRSRAGKVANLYVHAEAGVAYSAEDDEIHFIEVFRPRPQNAYEAEIYIDPGPFIR